MSKILSQKTLKFPICLTVAYLLLTLVIYRLCPYDWPTNKPALFFGLNLCYIAALCLGYFIGQRHRLGVSWIRWDEDRTEQLIKWVSIGVIINCVMYTIYIFRDYGYSIPNFIELAKDLMDGIQNPGAGYRAHLQRLQTINGADVLGGSVYTVINLLWSFVQYPIIILAMLYFRRMKWYGKVGAVFYLVLVVLFYTSIGTNIQFFHVFLLIALPVILSLFDHSFHKTLNKRILIRSISLLLVGLLLVAFFFAWMMESRSAAAGYDIDEYEIEGLRPNISYSENSSQQPSKLTNLWISFSSYLTQGYYGMSLALDKCWTPMFGFGSSMFIIDLISKNFFDIDQYTYQVKLEPAWDSDVRWHSMYTWIANDVSFYGVVVVMFVFGLLFGMMFKDAVVNRNPLAKASMFFFILMLVFIPCNHQIAQSSITWFPFWLLCILWLIVKPKQDTDNASRC